MENNFLDYTGLQRYHENVKKLVDTEINKVENNITGLGKIGLEKGKIVDKLFSGDKEHGYIYLNPNLSNEEIEDLLQSLNIKICARPMSGEGAGAYPIKGGMCYAYEMPLFKVNRRNNLFYDMGYIGMMMEDMSVYTTMMMQIPQTTMTMFDPIQDYLFAPPPKYVLDQLKADGATVDNIIFHKQAVEWAAAEGEGENMHMISSPDEAEPGEMVIGVTFDIYLDDNDNGYLVFGMMPYENGVVRPWNDLYMTNLVTLSDGRYIDYYDVEGTHIIVLTDDTRVAKLIYTDNDNVLKDDYIAEIWFMTGLTFSNKVYSKLVINSKLDEFTIHTDIDLDEVYNWIDQLQPQHEYSVLVNGSKGINGFGSVTVHRDSEIGTYIKIGINETNYITISSIKVSSTVEKGVNLVSYDSTQEKWVIAPITETTSFNKNDYEIEEDVYVGYIKDGFDYLNGKLIENSTSVETLADLISGNTLTKIKFNKNVTLDEVKLMLDDTDLNSYYIGNNFNLQVSTQDGLSIHISNNNEAIQTRKIYYNGTWMSLTQDGYFILSQPMTITESIKGNILFGDGSNDVIEDASMYKENIVLNEVLTGLVIDPTAKTDLEMSSWFSGVTKSDNAVFQTNHGGQGYIKVTSNALIINIGYNKFITWAPSSWTFGEYGEVPSGWRYVNVNEEYAGENKETGTTLYNYSLSSQEFNSPYTYAFESEFNYVTTFNVPLTGLNGNVLGMVRPKLREVINSVVLPTVKFNVNLSKSYVRDLLETILSQGKTVTALNNNGEILLDDVEVTSLNESNGWNNYLLSVYDESLGADRAVQIGDTLDIIKFNTSLSVVDVVSALSQLSFSDQGSYSVCSLINDTVLVRYRNGEYTIEVQTNPEEGEYTVVFSQYHHSDEYQWMSDDTGYQMSEGWQNSYILISKQMLLLYTDTVDGVVIEWNSDNNTPRLNGKNGQIWDYNNGWYVDFVNLVQNSTVVKLNELANGVLFGAGSSIVYNNLKGIQISVINQEKIPSITFNTEFNQFAELYNYVSNNMSWGLDEHGYNFADLNMRRDSSYRLYINYQNGNYYIYAWQEGIERLQTIYNGSTNTWGLTYIEDSGDSGYITRINTYSSGSYEYIDNLFGYVPNSLDDEYFTIKFAPDSPWMVNKIDVYGRDISDDLIYITKCNTNRIILNKLMSNDEIIFSMLGGNDNAATTEQVQEMIAQAITTALNTSV